MIVKLLTEDHLEFLSLTGGCGGSSESTLVKMSNCWKSQSTAHFSWFIGISVVILVSSSVILRNRDLHMTFNSCTPDRGFRCFYQLRDFYFTYPKSTSRNSRTSEVTSSSYVAT